MSEGLGAAGAGRTSGGVTAGGGGPPCMGCTQGLVGYSMRVTIKDSREPGGARRAAAGGTEGDREGWGSAGGQAGDHKHLMRQENRSRRKAGGKT